MKICSCASAQGSCSIKLPQKPIVVDLKSVDYGIFVAEISIGTPPQKQKVVFDSGSSDTLLLSKTFDSDKTRTFKNLQTPFNIQYFSGPASGLWGQDNIVLGDTKILNLRLAVGELAKPFSVDFGIIGLGLEKFETTYTTEFGINRKFPHTSIQLDERHTYPNFPTKLKEQGLPRSLYSVSYTDDFESSTIIFGGVDTAKYNSLITVPVIQRSTGDWSDYKESVLLAVGLDSIELKGGNSTQVATTKNYPALVDTMTLITAFPSPVIQKMEQILGGKYILESTGIVYPCNTETIITFTFGGSTLSLPVDQMSVQTEGYCLYEVEPSPDDFIILGSTFMRNFYTVFDLDSLEISLGNAIYTEASTIVSVGPNSNVPKSSGVKNCSSVFRYQKSD